ncbi:hypothetical protein DVH24_020400 [Malus domestica]|uniref:Uncharacterized protein n=1 Tax=Malus domestica TaxID=3750 RepID=A0A498J9I4_MALDO|nr:hypothetical protein DVH24_020400 [Malus domestica]
MYDVWDVRNLEPVLSTALFTGLAEFLKAQLPVVVGSAHPHCIIARNFHGDFVAARVARFENVFSPAHIEALATREGLSLCVERGYQNFLLGSDFFRIVTALREPLVNRFFIGPVIEDAKANSSSITGGSSAHVR